jgi:DNA-binding Lrp family transcriptional regulator
LATVYVLITVQTGSEEKVMTNMKLIPEVKEAHMVYGAYDIIARVETNDMEALKNVISWRIRRLEEIRNTITSIVVTKK